MSVAVRLRGVRLLVGTAALSAVLAAASTAAANAPSASPSVTPAGSTPNAWGWVTGRLPTTVTYLVPERDGRDAVASQPYVTRRTGPGSPSYLVTFPYAANGRATAPLASSLGSAAVLCGVADPPSPNDLNELVMCRDRHGTLINSRFSVMWLGIGDLGPGHVAYVFAGGPTPGDYTPSSNTFNSSHVANHVTRLGIGRWRVFLPNLGALGGHPQVTGDNGTPCRTVSWVREQSAGTAAIGPQQSPYGSEIVDITCRDFNGQYQDAFWWLVFVDGVTQLGDFGTTGAYLWANQPTSASYHPSATYRYSSAGTTPTVTRSGVGTYAVILPGMPTGGAAVVTPTGPGKALCGLTSIRTTGTPQRVGVHCWRPDGRAVDSAFLLGYVH